MAKKQAKRGTAASDNLQVSLVALVCGLILFIFSTQFLHLAIAAPVLGILVLYIAYRLSSGWTPVPEMSPTLFWSVSLVLTTFVEIILVWLTK